MQRTLFLYTAEKTDFIFCASLAFDIFLKVLFFFFLYSDMALSSAFFSTSQLFCVSFKVDRPRLLCSTWRSNIRTQRFGTPLKRKNMKMFGLTLGREANQISTGFSFPRARNSGCRKSSAIHASWMPCAEFASGAFTVGTAAVLPFYTLMIVAPRAEFTKKIIGSNLPYMVLGVLYAYLLYLSWTPDTIRTIFATKYLLPELPGIVKMFSSEMTMASAWIHLLTVDLFAARQVYGDGLQNNIETRHSISLCLLFCPIGILAHAITKALTIGRTEVKKTEFTKEEEAIF